MQCTITEFCGFSLELRGQLISKLQAPDPSEQGGSLLPMGVLLLAPIQQNPISIPLARLVGCLNTPPTLSFPLKEPHSECPVTNSPLITKHTHTQGYNIRDLELHSTPSHIFPFLSFLHSVSFTLESLSFINSPIVAVGSYSCWKSRPD